MIIRLLYRWLWSKCALFHRWNHTLPNRVNNVFVFKLVKNTIASQHNKVMVILIYFKETYIRIGYNNFWIAQKIRYFCFNISKSSTNT